MPISLKNFKPFEAPTISDKYIEKTMPQYHFIRDALINLYKLKGFSLVGTKLSKFCV